MSITNIRYMKRKGRLSAMTSSRQHEMNVKLGLYSLSFALSTTSITSR